QVPSDTIGPKGRQVQCAHCGKTWQAYAEQVLERTPKPAASPASTPARRDDEDDQLFDAAAEAELDAAFEAEQRAAAGLDQVPPLPPVLSIEEIKAAIAPKVQDAPGAKPVDPQSE